MEVTALCIRLLMNMSLLLAAQLHSCCCSQNTSAVFPHLEPNRLQFFEYEQFSVKCEARDGSTGWRVMRKLREDPPTANQREPSTGSISIKFAFASDSGEYWCENEDRKRSNTVNITVTAGSVILESPALTSYGDNVTLHCRQKTTTNNLAAEFYKDGLRIETGYKGTMTIHGVSESEEGFYKCSISAGESPESWLTVREIQENPETSTDSSLHFSTLISVVFTILFVALLVLGILYCHKHRAGCFSSETTTQGIDLVSGKESRNNTQMVTYAVVTKHCKKRALEDRRAGRENDIIYSTIQ